MTNEMDLIIKANGTWWHEGQQIHRQSMIDLFAKVLWLENGEYFLKTPVEKIKIQVEDAPFLITDIIQIEIDGFSYLQCQTQNKDVFLIDEQHLPILKSNAFNKSDQDIRPYLPVRFGMLGLIERQTFYHLVSLGTLEETKQGVVLHLQSGLLQFSIHADF